jgi:hypothetical protein
MGGDLRGGGGATCKITGMPTRVREFCIAAQQQQARVSPRADRLAARRGYTPTGVVNSGRPVVQPSPTRTLTVTGSTPVRIGSRLRDDRAGALATARISYDARRWASWIWPTPCAAPPAAPRVTPTSTRPISAVVSSDAQVSNAVTPHHQQPVGAWLAPADNITDGPMPDHRTSGSRMTPPNAQAAHVGQGTRSRCSWSFSHAGPTHSSASMRRSDQPCPTLRTPK